MKAIVYREYGSPGDVLELREIDKPVVKDGEVLVRVSAASVHAGDWLMVRGQPYIARLATGLRRPKNNVAGTDLAGTVEAVGKDVTRFQPGDELFGWCDGAFAEYASAEEDHFVPKPAGLTFEQAATIATSAIAALQALRDKGEVQPGQKVLVIGASGGVGMFAVQIATAFGADVTGVCSTRNVDMVRSIGADHVIDYTQEDFTKSGERYDVIFDTAGNRSLSDLRRALSSRGTLVIGGGRGGPWLMGIDRQFRALVMSPFVSQRLRALASSRKHEDLVVLKELIEAGKVTPVIDTTYPLSQTPEAVGHVDEGHTQGKTVVTA